MESDTAIKNPKQKRTNLDKLMDLYWGGTERRISALTVRIIGINALSLIVLMLSIISMGQYETQILTAKLESFHKETTIIAQTIANSKIDQSQLLKNLKQTTGYEITVFDTAGHKQNSTSKNNQPPQPPATSVNASIAPLQYVAKLLIAITPNRKTLPTYPKQTDTLPEIQRAAKGLTNITAWNTDNKNIILTGTVPIITNDQAIIGAVHIARSGHDISQDLRTFWIQMLRIFLITLVTTIIISIYLSGTITRPLRKLTRAAETIRRTKSPHLEIPDLSDRLDEIGELSLVMRDMTESLWDKLTAIERFSADVAHELKNPLTSLKSAVETLKISKKKKDQETLLALLQHDIERMDRLITDISSASKLDTDLSRQSLETININEILTQTADRYNKQYTGTHTIALNLPQHKTLYAKGLTGHIMQVIDNIVSNAISFSKDQDTITITAVQNDNTVTITIEDQGPGIPENKLDTIFERFYTERPDHESYGNHSGLGLSICKQIITAMGGNIKATNKLGQTGARFTITLNKQ